MAVFEHRSVPGPDVPVREIVAKPGDSLEKIAKAQGSTVDTLKSLNPLVGVLRPGQVLMYQKASVQRVITGWRSRSTALIAQRYNGGGDPNYARKLEYASTLVRNRRVASCAQ
ncbi:MAG: LysM domain-containing protein [Pseudomonadota bacterium]